MTEKIITVIDVAGIQAYIFGSNRLKHNIGASFLVQLAGDEWVNDYLSRNSGELFYSGGGKTVLFFPSLDNAKQFATEYSQKVLEHAPGMQIYLAHHAMDWEREALGGANGALSCAHKKVASKKNSTPNRLAYLGWAVTADCQYSGLPASAILDGDRVSAEILAKEKIVVDANGSLQEKLNIAPYEFPSDMDDFGRTHGDSSYIAIVHIDGNGMGKRFQELSEDYVSPSQNQEFIEKMREFSKGVSDVAQDAMQATLKHLVSKIQSDGKGGEYIQDAYRLADMKIELSQKFLPFRPLVMGGDDVTFVCEGRLGLSLAHYFLKQITTPNLPASKPMKARAGVAIVKSHYPFAQAYQLAEDLAKSAKKDLPELKKGESGIDWHFATSGVLDGLTEIRKREYTVPTGSLHSRPLLLERAQQDTEWRNWETFLQFVKEFLRTEKESDWGNKRNKLKELREVLRKGGDETQQFLKLYGLGKLPLVAKIDDSLYGWVVNLDRDYTKDKDKDKPRRFCTVFDAIEALDWFLILEAEHDSQ
jgi:hypothetical protein